MYLLILQRRESFLIYCMRLRGEFDEARARWRTRCSLRFVKFHRKTRRPWTTIYALTRALFSPLPFFCKSLSNRFLSKIYNISIYLCIRLSHACSSFLVFFFSPRCRSPAQRSSNTYGYSNDQGILDGSDMESLSRRCSPSESIVSILCPPCPDRRLRSHEIFARADNRRDYSPAYPLFLLSLLLVNFRLVSSTLTRDCWTEISLERSAICYLSRIYSARTYETCGPSKNSI